MPSHVSWTGDEYVNSRGYPKRLCKLISGVELISISDETGRVSAAWCLFCSMRKMHCWEKRIKAYLKTQRTSSKVHFSHYIFCRQKHDDPSYFCLNQNWMCRVENKQINKQNPQSKTTHSLIFPCISRIKCSLFSFMKSLIIGISKEDEMYLGQRNTQTPTADVFAKARCFAGCSDLINVTMIMTTV